jgi:hypothetical protein
MHIEIKSMMTPLLACALLAATQSGAAVTVDRKPAVIERKMFDPAHHPSDMPPLAGNESAVTQSHFECNVTLNFEVLGRKEEGGKCKTELKVREVGVALQLRIVIWLPEGATPKLTAHEEGHRQITERVYGSAEKIARQIAQSLDGQTISGDAPNCQGAERQATQAAAGQFCQSYLDQTARPSAHLSEIYDELTAHGTRAEPTEDEAIRQTFERVRREAGEGRVRPTHD